MLIVLPVQADFGRPECIGLPSNITLPLGKEGLYKRELHIPSSVHVLLTVHHNVDRSLQRETRLKHLQ